MENHEFKQRHKTQIVRATISFPGEHYVELERMAHERKVSVAWIVRDAVEKYLVDQWPLLQGLSKKKG